MKFHFYNPQKANLAVQTKFVRLSHQPLLPRKQKFRNFNRKFATIQVVYKIDSSFLFFCMVFGVGQLNYASQISLIQAPVAVVTKICDFQHKFTIT